MLFFITPDIILLNTQRASLNHPRTGVERNLLYNNYIACMGNTVSVKSPLLTKQTNTIEAINVILLHVATVQLSSKLTLACVSHASTQNFCEITREFVVSA